MQEAPKDGPSQERSTTEPPKAKVPSWCQTKPVKKTLSKTGCPVLDDLAEKIHQSGSCSGHQTPQRQQSQWSADISQATLANAAARVSGRVASGPGSAVPGPAKDASRVGAAASRAGSASGLRGAASRQDSAPTLQRSHSFPEAIAASSRAIVPETETPPADEIAEEGIEEGCTAETIRKAADGVTADDPDLKDAKALIDGVSLKLKEGCMLQLISLKQKLLREFAEVLCLVERKYTIKYAESLGEAREQQTVARYYQTMTEKNVKIVEKMADALHRRRQRNQLAKCFKAWYEYTQRRRLAAKRSANRNAQDEESTDCANDDCIDIEYKRTEEVGNKVYERKLTAQLPKPGASSKDSKKHSMSKKQSERLRLRRIEQLECELEMSKRREQLLINEKHDAEAKYLRAMCRMQRPSRRDDCRGDGLSQPVRRTTTVRRRRVDDCDPTLPLARVRRALSECRPRRRWRPRAPPPRHTSCVAPLAVFPCQRTAECVKSRTQRRPCVRVERRRSPRPCAGDESDSSGPAPEPAAARAPCRKTEITEKWRHLPRT